MTQVICWVIFPLVLALLSLGCGLLLERVAGARLPGGLLMPVGLAVIIVVAEVTTKSGATARFTTPAVVALALLGVVLGRPWRRDLRLGAWPLAAAGAVYLAYLAPVLLSGEPTFTGFVKLDDTATWMAMTDRVLSHGHDLSGLAPSSYQTTLHFYLTGGEPVGAMLPWGIGHQLVGQDLAWVFQPYLAFLGAMLALSAWSIVGPLVRSRWLRALVVFIAAQAALIYGYSLWGGIKEMAAACLLALSVACTIPVIERRARVRSFLPLAAASFAMLGVYGFGGAVWLALTLVVVAVGAVGVWVRTMTRAQIAGLIGLSILLAVGLIRGAQGFVKSNGPLTSSELGNLVHPLNWLQLFGIWPAGDFRVDPPSASAITHALIVVVMIAACVGLLAGWRRRCWTPALYLAGAAVGVALVSLKGSPWVQGKAFAAASPATLLLGLVGTAALFDRPRGVLSWERGDRRRWLVGARRTIAALGSIAIAGGVLWSNVSAYHHVTLAPYGQLTELAQIGQRFAGQGPTMINEYETYADRHFLRAMDPESPSELRVRVIPLLGGGQVAKGGYADLDQFQVSGLLVYRTIVIRTSPAASRPPAPYQLVYDGRWYQVWQRPVKLARTVIDSLPLGSSIDPTGVPACRDVLRLAREAGAGGLLAAVSRPSPTANVVPSPLPEGDTTLAFVITTPGRYELWLGGSFVRRLTTSVDGRPIGSIRNVLNEDGGWTPLGEFQLGVSAHRVTLAYGDSELAPGSGGPGAAGPFFPVGPFAVSQVTGSSPVTYLRPPAARTLCGRSWDWIEALGPRQR
jgi:hypothetical protein